MSSEVFGRSIAVGTSGEVGGADVGVCLSLHE